MSEHPVQMTRAKDGAKALVESWEVKLWEGYGFQVAGAKPADIDVVDPTPDQAVPAKRGRKSQG